MSGEGRPVPLKVLLVDPDAGRRARLSGRLRELPGWTLELEAAGGGDEGLERLSREPFDAVFLSLPDADAALASLERLRQLHPKTAVILVAAGGGERLAAASIQRGAIDYLPAAELPSADLGALLRRVVERRFLFDENMELRQVNQMKNEFIANVSHELRTPLSVIIGYAETLRGGGLGELNEAQRRALESIVGRSEDLLRTLNQILRIREAHEAKGPAALAPLELRGWLADRATQPGKEFARKRLRLELRLPEGERWVRADAERLGAVLENLLSNAAKFSPEGGAVTLALADQDGALLVSVADRGPGVPPEMLPRVFERFSAAGLGPTRDRPGLGLGLPFCKQVIEQHGGKIWLESRAGQGCAAVFTLPAAGAGAPAPSTRARRILIVEDNSDIIEVLELFLSSIDPGFEVSTARSGFEALDRLKDGLPDALILDVMMPGMNGFELIERLRRSPETARIPVLLLTGYTEAARHARETGAGEVLMKPFEKKTFVAALTRLLEKAR